MTALPSYLAFHTDGAPHAHAVIHSGDVRFTVVTPYLVRIEQGAFTDCATLVALHRAFCDVSPAVTREGAVTRIDTGALIIRHDAALPLQAGLTIRREAHPAFTWHWGQRPLQNLKGTASTLDGVNGSCELMDGLCAIDGFAVMDDSASPLFREDGWFRPREACSDVYFFGYGHDYTRCIQDYLRLTGAPGLLPAFALGNWWSRYYPYSADEYLKLMDRFHDEDIPLSVGIIDMDWHGTVGPDHSYEDGWTGWTWNRDLFPDYKDFIRQLHGRQLKTALNLHPAQGVRHWDMQYEDMCRAMGRDPSLRQPIPFNCLSVDFLKEYFERLLFPYEEDGVDFWWMDWQQGCDYRKIAGDTYRETGLDAITPLWMLNHTHYLAAQRHGGRAMIFSRFAGYGSQRYPIGFSGDTYITWKSLDFQPYFTAAASNVGYGWWSHDIGGHMGGERNDELTARWVQLGLLSPIFRLHSSNGIFNGREPWMYNPRSRAVIADCMRKRHQLFPYLYTMNRRAHEQLIPLVRPMYHVSPEDAGAYQAPNEYWFGSEMIVAPVTAPADETGLASTRAYLPEGRWIDANTGMVYKGGQTVELFRPLEEEPVFLKCGAIVPVQQHVPGDAKLGGAKGMAVLVAPGASGRFDLYEDDGVTLNYQQGQYAQTALTLDYEETSASFTIHPAAGDASLVPARQWTVHLRGWRRGCAFTADGREIPSRWDAATCTYTIALPEMEPDAGVTLTIRNERGLMHDNADLRARYIDRLTRAQCLMNSKSFMLMRYDDAIRHLETHPSLRASTDLYPTLEGMLQEHIDQWKP